MNNTTRRALLTQRLNILKEIAELKARGYEAHTILSCLEGAMVLYELEGDGKNQHEQNNHPRLT